MEKKCLLTHSPKAKTTDNQLTNAKPRGDPQANYILNHFILLLHL